MVRTRSVTADQHRHLAHDPWVESSSPTRPTGSSSGSAACRGVRAVGSGPALRARGVLFDRTRAAATSTQPSATGRAPIDAAALTGSSDVAAALEAVDASPPPRMRAHLDFAGAQPAGGRLRAGQARARLDLAHRMPTARSTP